MYESIFDFTTGTQTNEKYSYSNFKVSVPNVRGMTQAAAEEELKAYGFKVEVKTATSLNTPSGTCSCRILPTEELLHMALR